MSDQEIKSGKGESFDVMSLDVGDMDVKAASNTGAVMQFKNPWIKGKKLAIHAEMLGKHSDAFRELIKDRADRRALKAHAATLRGDDPEIRLSAQAEQEAIETLALMTKRLFTIDANGNSHDVAVVNGVVYKNNDQGKLAFYAAFPWAREDADNFIGAMENFTPASQQR